MKKSLVSLALTAAVAQVIAGEAPIPAERLVACTDVQESLARLACFDREIVPFANSRVASSPVRVPVPGPAPGPAIAPAPSPAAPRSAPLPAAPANQPAPSLGEEQLDSSRRPRADEETQSLTARITGLREAGGGAYVVALDNGQTWRHENQHLGSYLREGESVTIRKATLGAYRLTRDAGATRDWIRVTRIR